jgi:hypothetical protein
MMVFAVVMIVPTSFIMVMGAALRFVPELAVKISDLKPRLSGCRIFTQLWPSPLMPATASSSTRRWTTARPKNLSMLPPVV